MLNFIIGVIIFGAGILAGIIVIGLLRANSYTEKYEEGYHAGYSRGRTDEKLEIMMKIEKKFGESSENKSGESGSEIG